MSGVVSRGLFRTRLDIYQAVVTFAAHIRMRSLILSILPNSKSRRAINRDVNTVTVLTGCIALIPWRLPDILINDERLYSSLVRRTVQLYEAITPRKPANVEMDDYGQISSRAEPFVPHDGNHPKHFRRIFIVVDHATAKLLTNKFLCLSGTKIF